MCRNLGDKHTDLLVIVITTNNLSTTCRLFFDPASNCNIYRSLHRSWGPRSAELRCRGMENRITWASAFDLTTLKRIPLTCPTAPLLPEEFPAVRLLSTVSSSLRPLPWWISRELSLCRIKLSLVSPSIGRWTSRENHIVKRLLMKTMMSRQSLIRMVDEILRRRYALTFTGNEMEWDPDLLWRHCDVLRKLRYLR